MSFTVLLLLLLCSAPIAAAGPSPLLLRAIALADHITTCAFAPESGTFVDEQLWQSGNTLESLANVMIAARPYNSSLTPVPNWAAVVATSFAKTPVIVDKCADDHQWWLLGWIKAYHATGVVAYLERAAAIFDFIATNAWSTDSCGGGVVWCPPPTSPYKNAITNELFLSAAMGLHPYSALLKNGNASFYLQWAEQEWAWLDGSGMRNAQNLFNDGLNGADHGASTCVNNNQTTWTYNQGVLLSGLAQLSAATQNATTLAVARAVASAAIEYLSVDGILVEPCGASCGLDGEIFKGVFARHAGYLAQMDAGAAPAIGAFLSFQANSIINADACIEGGYGFRWEGPCDLSSTATATAALDALTAAAVLNSTVGADTAFVPLALGNCMDATGAGMSNCMATNISENACRDAAAVDPLSHGFDFYTDCLGITVCRVRTLANNACESGFTFASGPATSIAGGTGSSLALCFVRAALFT